MPPAFNLSWDSYKANICAGFSKLQQQAEFVDMTLAAEGHFVKVHKNLVALASPYLKQILQSAPCQHPVIFLSQISQKVLSYILEYIYTGQVQVPTDDMNSFIEACKGLHIVGVENILPVKNIVKPSNPLVPAKVESPSKQNNFAAHITINDINQLDVQHFVNEQITYNNEIMSNNVPVNVMNNITANVIEKPTIDYTFQSKNELELIQELPILVDSNNYSLDNINNDVQYNNTNQVQICDDPVENLPSFDDTDNSHLFSLPDPSTTCYTISNRGSLQLIFNKFIYYTTFTSQVGKKRRWRCIDYRKLKCSAFIDTEDETVVKSECLHNHYCHENKIYKKAKTNYIYTTISAAEKAARDKARVNDIETVMESSE